MWRGGGRWTSTEQPGGREESGREEGGRRVLDEGAEAGAGSEEEKRDAKMLLRLDMSLPRIVIEQAR